MAKSSSPSIRRQRAVESFKNASDFLGDVVPGMALFGVTRGQFSMVDLVLATLDQIGPAKLTLWTWTVAEYEIATLERLRTDQRLTGGLLVIDGGARHKNASLIRQWKGTFGPESVRYVLNHAKIATLENDLYRVLLRGSCNLNFNPRFEQVDVTEGGLDFDLVHDIELGLPVLDDDAPGEAVYAASRVSNAFDSSQLKLFGSLKPWAK